MATFNITTVQNIDELSGKTGGDTYNSNGGTLIIDQDSRVGLNQTTSSTLGPMTISASLGGLILVDGRKIRHIPFENGTGNVPAWNTLITQGGASGKLIGVFSGTGVASTATGAAMPASGFLKIKQWNDVAYSAGALTGISADATGPDVVGVLNVTGEDATNVNVPRLGRFEALGAWFEVGVTSGNYTTLYQPPSMGLIQHYGGVWIETEVGSGIYEKYTCQAHGTTHIPSLSADLEKTIHQDGPSNNGSFRIGWDGVTSAGARIGYVPPAGLRIRMPNVVFSCSTSANRTINVYPNASAGSRKAFVTTSSGDILFDKVCSNWANVFNTAYAVNIADSALGDNLTLANVAYPFSITNSIMGTIATTPPAVSIVLTNMRAGGTFDDIALYRNTLGTSGNYCVSMADSSNIAITNSSIKSSFTGTGRHATSGTFSITRCADTTLDGNTYGGGRILLATCQRTRITNSKYVDTVTMTGYAANTHYFVDASLNCIDTLIEGLTFPQNTAVARMKQPGSGIIQLASGCDTTKIRNIGTYLSPESLGSARVEGTWTRVSTTITITCPASIGVGGTMDQVYVVVSSNTAALTVGVKSVTGVSGEGVFTITGLNAGATSGTCSLFGARASNVLVFAASGSTLNTKVQRVFTPHTRANLLTGDNTHTGITFENVFGDYLNAYLTPMGDTFYRNVSGTPLFTGQTAVYGTHWANGYVCDVAENTVDQGWTRSGTTVTVTAPEHKLRTGLTINVTSTSDSSAIRTGAYTVTCLTKDVFTITGVSAGATSGTLSFQQANGRIALLMNEASTKTAGLYTLDAGNPAFTATGGLYMPNVGDQITFTTPIFIKGQGSTFPNIEAVMAVGTLTNYDVLYQIDKNDGNGYSAWRYLSYPRTGASGTSGQFTFTVTDATGVQVGMAAFGTGIHGHAVVTNVTSNTITVNKANTATVSGIARFSELLNETGMNPALGIKMKWRLITNTANVTAPTSLYIWTESTPADREHTYPLEVVDITLQNLQPGSEVRAYTTSAGQNVEEIDGIENSGTSFTFSAESGQVINIMVNHLNFLPADIFAYTVPQTSATLQISQFVDRNYFNPV